MHGTPRVGHLGRRQDRVDGRRALQGQRLPQVARLHDEQVAALGAGHQALALACAGAALQGVCFATPFYLLSRQAG